MSVPTVVDGDFEWDDEKAALNQAKHGVSFEEAATALTDPDAVYLLDSAHSERFGAVEFSVQARCLFVVHVERGVRDRIISARVATETEQRLYSRAR